jgi:3-isopropylmalate/(R)-2-methylmalate dehydratase small subunit
MQPFTTLHGVAASLPWPDINTDAIIPSVWLRAPDGNLADGLFGMHRAEADFVLNRAPFDRARILVAGANFGCGSSREAAVWALADFGIGCVIASSFADIFYENAFKNGVLAAVVPTEVAATLTDWLATAPTPELAVELAAQTIRTADGRMLGFDVPATRKQGMLAGRDELDDLLGHLPEIAAFREADRARRPWVHAAEANAT